jgi:hypothetical protein
MLLVPTVREFVPKSGSERQIGPQLYDVLNIPGAYGRDDLSYKNTLVCG